MAVLMFRHRRPVSVRRAIAAVLGAMALIGLCSVRVDAQRTASFDEVKAAFVFQFANYVTWPDDVLESDTSPIKVGVVGNENVAKLLADTARQRKAGNHPIEVVEITSPADAEACQIVFVDKSGGDAIEKYVEALSGKPVLTVSDDDEFTAKGGIIRVYEQANKPKLEVNVDEVERAKLTISSKLLGLAKIVRNR